MIFLLLFTIISSCLCQVYKSEPYYFINIQQGTIRGLKVDDTYRFLGVPYASRPVRFKEPFSASPWPGVRDAIAEAPPCFQYVSKLKTFAGSEDCLYANIYTPTLQNKKLPIMVYVHSGNFKTGQGSLPNNQKFVTTDTILVQFNYRLGVFGFLSSQTGTAPGNAGLKDMTIFLRWLKKNAMHFGGDPDNVTLFGANSGAVAIDLLTLSDATRGLYNKIITFSGTASDMKLFNKNPLKSVFMLGKSLKINTQEVDVLVERLKSVPPEILVAAAENLDNDLALKPFRYTFVPSAEAELPGVQYFINEYPDNILTSGLYNKVPQMMGFMTNEGLSSYNKMKGDFEAFSTLLERFLPDDVLQSAIDLDVVPSVANKIRSFYSVNGGFQDYISDSKVTIDMIRNVKLKLKQANREDIYFVEYDEGSNQLSTLIAMMINFAKYGNPTPSNSALVTWKPISSASNFEYLKVSSTIQMSKNPIQNRIQFWDSLLIF